MSADSSDQKSIEMPASMASWDELIDFVRERADACITDPGKSYRLLLAVEELLSNIIRASSEHMQDASEQDPAASLPCSAMVRVCCTRLPAQHPGESAFTLFETYDNCPAYDPQLDLIPVEMDDIPIELRAIGGLGLFLVKSSVDQVDYEYVDDQNHYRLLVHDST